MSFTLDLTEEQQALRERTHAFARDVIRPVAAEYDRAQEFPWPVLEEAARAGLYDWRLYAELSLDPTGLSLPLLMEELFWGCAGIGLSIVMPALALAAIRQAATDEELVRWAPECFGTPDDVLTSPTLEQTYGHDLVVLEGGELAVQVQHHDHTDHE